MYPLLPLLFVVGLLPFQDGYIPPTEMPAPLVAANLAWDTHNYPPKPKPAPKPTPNAYRNGNVEQWRSLVEQYFEAGDVDEALCTMSGESGGSPTAKNATSSAAGLWQFLRSTWNNMVPASVTGGSYESGAVYDPVASTRAAAWLWYNVGPSQWNAHRRC